LTGCVDCRVDANRRRIVERSDAIEHERRCARVIGARVVVIANSGVQHGSDTFSVAITRVWPSVLVARIVVRGTRSTRGEIGKNAKMCSGVTVSSGAKSIMPSVRNTVCVGNTARAIASFVYNTVTVVV
jgi:hypothetical protein